MSLNKKLEKLYCVSCEKHGELEGMFDSNEKLLGAWFGNDANWRGEYFDGFIEELGYEIEYIDGDDRPDLVKKMLDIFGMSEEDNENDEN